MRSAASQNRDRTKRRGSLRPRLCSAPFRKCSTLRCVRGTKICQSHRSRTYECIPIPVSRTSLILLASCSKERGARERHGRGAGCGGRGSVRREGSDGAEPAGSVSCKPDADVRRWRGRLRRVVPVSRVASRPGGEPDPTGKGNPQSVTTATKSVSAAGEQRDKPLKPLRAERWEAGVSVVTNSYALFQKLHARLRVHWAPGVPHALFSKRVGRSLAKLGRMASRDRGSVAV